MTTFIKHRIYTTSSGVHFEFIGHAEGRFSQGKLLFKSNGTTLEFNADGTHPTDSRLNITGEHSMQPGRLR